MTITPTNINKHPEPKPAFRFEFDVSTENHLYFHNSGVKFRLKLTCVYSVSRQDSDETCKKS